MKLTDTQLVILSAASQREDCAIELAPRVKGAAALYSREYFALCRARLNPGGVIRAQLVKG